MPPENGTAGGQWEMDVFIPHLAIRLDFFYPVRVLLF